MPDDMNGYGSWFDQRSAHPDIITPNIHSFAQDAVNFVNAHSTGAACNPSRTSMWLGITPAETGITNNNTFFRDVPALANIRTFFQYLLSQGIPTYESGKVFHRNRGTDLHPHPASDPISWTHQFPTNLGAASSGGTDQTVGGITWKSGLNVTDPFAGGDGRALDTLIKFIDTTFNKNYLAVWGGSKPHLKWRAPHHWFDLYDTTNLTLPTFVPGDLDDIPRGNERSGNKHTTIYQPSGKWKDLVHAYLACYSYADGQIGRALDFIEQHPESDNFIVVVLSDHGWHLGEKDSWKKFQLWEESTLAPLIIKVPWFNQSGKVREAVSYQDLIPTLCELLNIPRMPGVRGRSLVPFLQNPDTTIDLTFAYTVQGGSFNKALRTKDWRYHRIPTSSVFEYELYYLPNDPLCLINLAKFPEYDKIRTALDRCITLIDIADPNASYANKYPYQIARSENVVGSIIEAENYDIGLVSPAYADDQQKQGDLSINPYDSTDFYIVTGLSGPTVLMSWLEEGEYTEYSVQANPGTYKIKTRATTPTPSSFDLYVDGEFINTIAVDMSSVDSANDAFLTYQTGPFTVGGDFTIRLAGNGNSSAVAIDWLSVIQ